MTRNQKIKRMQAIGFYLVAIGAVLQAIPIIKEMIS